ncbi:S-layer homology domain-containing protein [Paenibacillus solisilvae]|uniref:S-layer homology domain-containing protein n=1 Tax=Paenibacillus solisilvae TaxID=2486751 RepID=A0ABW0VX89_9BACL
MKKVIMSKTAALIASLMIISMLVPVLAFAAPKFENVTITSNGTVTGQVYVTDDVYTPGMKVPVYVYASDNMTPVGGVVYGIYTANGHYSFTTTVPSVSYDTYYFMHYGSVTEKVYYTPFNGGGGGGFPGTGNSNYDDLFKDGKDATITADSDTVSIPADKLVDGNSLTIKNADGTSITLPIAALKLADQAKSLGVELKDLVIRVELKKLSGDAAKAVTDAVYEIGAETLAAPVDFKIVAVGNGKEQQINDLGTYFKRTLPVTGSVYSDNTVGVVYNPDTKELNFVPATFATENGITIATLNRTSTSIYTVIQTDAASFKDLAVHWSKKEVEALAGKLVVNGTGDNMFSPNRNITRAEFAALIVRALGLDATGTSSDFTDVTAGQWYSGAVATAAEAGIITGYVDGTFKPNATVSRSEMSAMISRALKYAGKDINLSATEVAAALAKFSDAGTLGWAKSYVATAVSEGLIKGQSANKLAGNSLATRAEAAAIVYRFLGNVGFIN